MANSSPEGIYGLKTIADQLAMELDSWKAQLAHQSLIASTAYINEVPAAYDLLEAGIGRNSDVWLLHLTLPSSPDKPVLVAFISGIVAPLIIEQDIVAPLMHTGLPWNLWNQSAVDSQNVSSAKDWAAILKQLASSKPLLFAHGLELVWVIDTAKYPQRSVARPQTELAVGRSEEAFTESLTQKAQMRHRIHSPALLFLDGEVGWLQQSTVSVAYIEGLANPALATTAVERLKTMDVASVVSSTQISGLIRVTRRRYFLPHGTRGKWAWWCGD